METTPSPKAEGKKEHMIGIREGNRNFLTRHSKVGRNCYIYSHYALHDIQISMPS
jgi:hypothetical protein